VVRTRGPHFFVDAVDGDHATLTGDEARHLTAVLRARAGDPVSLADGSGVVWQARVVATGDPVRVALTHRQDVPVPRPRLTVVHALPKGRKLDEAVQRLSEVGVDRLVPVHSARSQVRLEGPKADKAVQRWRAVALAAAKQSRRARLLDVAAVGDWTASFVGATGVVVWEEARVPLGEVAATWPADVDDVVLAVGPEGGLTDDEVRASGLPAALLGDTILRTETAALVAASVVLHRLGRLG
jgi:16S rRNA (uracil1498-N3)-methyltransferase